MVIGISCLQGGVARFAEIAWRARKLERVGTTESKI